MRSISRDPPRDECTVCAHENPQVSEPPTFRAAKRVTSQVGPSRSA
jgi:hypothetical protein